MVIRSRENILGAWAFLVGVVLAVLVGLSTTLIEIPFLMNNSAQVYAILVLLGLFVGFLNTAGRDSQQFLITGAILVIVSKFGMESVTGSFIGIGVGAIVRSTFGALLALFVPATIIVALKSIFSMSKI